MATTPQTIAVLGGAGGIGRALVAALVADGATVVVLDLPTSLQRHALDVASVPIDVTSEASVAAAMTAVAALVGPLDGFVNLAGFNATLQPLAIMPSDYFDTVIAGNLRGVYLAAKAVLPLLRPSGGAIVHVASGLAQHVRPGYGAYAAAKAGVIALTKTLAHEVAPGVRVNAVAPGLVDTAFLRGGTGRSGEDGDSLVDMAAYAAALPLKRLATPADIVGPMQFLLSPMSAYMTGQVLWVNGGGFMP